MSTQYRSTRSFDADDAQVVTLADGRIAHGAHIAQSDFVERMLHQVCPGVWSLVGNGLSNQSFIDAPDGIIAIDTGESNQEMTEALAELRTVTDRPIAAVLYTHFHYVGGTRVIFEDTGHEVPVHGHAGIDANRARTASVISTSYGRGLVEQFGITLDNDGPDGLVNVGLGHFYRNPDHAPFTVGYASPTVTFDAPTTVTVAGLDVHVTPAPSDADDSVTYWFPSLGVAVNNLVWPALFNVFAIRGEEYRDPRVLLTGLDHLLSLDAEHLVGAHGPPLSGQAEIAERVTRYRDAIQFLWDQSVRHINRGATGPELGHAIRLPAHCDDDPLTSETYGVAEHHVRQIRTGLFGFFDGDPAQLFPLEPVDRAERLIAGFGGPDAVRAEAQAAIETHDLRWALETAAWLVQATDATDGDRSLLASALRAVAQRTSSANVRNWCLTRARHLDGTFAMDRYLTHRFSGRAVLADPTASVAALRVLVDPDRMEGVNLRLTWQFDDGSAAALHIRNSIAVPLEPGGEPTDASITITAQAWADVLTGKTPWSQVEANITGDAAAVARTLAGFDLESLRS